MKKTLAVMTMLLTLTGCSSFESDWKAAAETPTPDDAITGRWTGTWLSDVNDHTGDLRAIITKIDDDTYEAHYHATWGAVSGAYKTKLHVTKREGHRVEFESSKDLGLFYGVYDTTGHITPTEYHAEYESKGDHGTNTLQRPQEDADE